jgi:hypothetical protein
MSVFNLVVITSLVLTVPALAQGTQQGATAQPRTSTGSSRTPVATQPSNDPFHNPIGQGVPPAASSNSNQNGNRTNTMPAR